MKTIYDLTQAVKRYLTSNTQLVNAFQGAASNATSLEVQIDAAIMDAANNARKFAERLHDFAWTEAVGSATLTHGSVLNISHVVAIQYYSDLGNEITPVRIDSGANVWPLVSVGMSLALATQNVEAITFGGSVVSPLVSGERYHVIEVIRARDGQFAFKFGATPGELQSSVAGLTMTFDLADFYKFKTVSQVNIYDPATRTSRPIKTIRRRTQSIRNQRLDMLSAYVPTVIEGEVVTEDKEVAIISGNYISVYPSAASQPITVEGHVWMDDYTHPADTDELLEHCFDFMLWQTVIEVNHMLLKFVPRQEGTLAPPTQARDAALESLVIWDSTKFDGNLYHDL